MSEVYVCPPEHKHAVVGTCYVIHKCRCEPCRSAQVARAAHRVKQQAYGRYDSGLVDAGPAREHLLMLREFGMGYKVLAAAAGVHITTTRTLLYGREDYVNGGHGPRHGEVKKRISRASSEAILAVKPDVSLLGSRVSTPGRGTRRRLQALVAIGWSQSKLAQQIGVHPSNFNRYVVRETAGAQTSLVVAELYERLWNTKPPHEEWRDKIAYNRSLSFAASRRWVTPMAWDDIDTDLEPPVSDEGGVDEVLVELAVQGEFVRLSPAERRLAVERLHSQLWSDKRIAERIHAAPRTVLRIREELGLAAFAYGDLVKREVA